MRVMVMVKGNADTEAGVMPTEEELREMGNYNERLVEAGVMKAGEGLHPTSKAVRVTFQEGGPVATDGPFAETKEIIAGFWLWEVKSMDEAVAWAKQIPFPPTGEHVDIRPIFEADDFGDEFTTELREQEERQRERISEL